MTTRTSRFLIVLAALVGLLLSGCHSQSPLVLAADLPAELGDIPREILVASWRIRPRPELEAELTRRGLVHATEWEAIRARDLSRVTSETGRWCVLGVPVKRRPEVELKDGRLTVRGPYGNRVPVKP